MQIKLGTYNVCHCADFNEPLQEDGRTFVSTERTAKLIKSLELDVFGLNEVFEQGPGEQYSKQTEKIASTIGYEYYAFSVGCKMEWSDSVDVIGNAIVSKYPIKSVETTPVLAPNENERVPEQNLWYENRVIVKTVVSIKNIDIVFIATHFGLNKSERLRMVDSLIDIINTESRPIILMGDFNTSPDNEELAPLLKKLNNVAETVGKKYEKTFESSNPSVTLDYIFVTKNFKVVDFQVVNKILSDHFPITAVLEI